MKRLANIAITAFVILAVSGRAGAQSQAEIASVKMPHAVSTTEDKTSLPTSGDSKIDSRFTDLLPEATHQKWTVSKDNFWVSFQNNNKQGRASFTKAGKMNYLIMDCAVEQLPASFRKTLSKDYPTYTIFNAIEIKTPETLAYQVVLENANKFITLKYTSGGVEEIQHVMKSR